MKQYYLYGASVQGIQSYIFRTNELRNIVEASAKIERICTADDDGLFRCFEENGGQSVIRAAGNIKYIFATREACEKAVLEFPKKVMQYAPGITLSQAVVELEGNDFERASDELEYKLRMQRNKPTMNVQLGLLGMKRDSKTGLPVVHEKDNGLQGPGSDATERLCSKMFGNTALLQARTSKNINDFVQQNDWIAIVHADGNGLGQVVQKLGGDKDTFSLFSKKLDEATCTAAKRAFESLTDEQKCGREGIIPMRPIVLGGDDLTIVCRGDVALPFVKAYLCYFEEETKRLLGDIMSMHHLFGKDPHLTACAGVAFIKSSYPFHYGYGLAENLCSQAKADAKRKERLQAHDGLAPSCLMFYKVQDSFVEDFRSIELRELTPCRGHSFKYGPYYLHEEQGRCTLDRFVGMCRRLDESKEGNAVKSAIRKWLTAMHSNVEVASQVKKRALAMRPSDDLKALYESATCEELRTETVKACMAYDLLAYHAIVSQKTK